MSPLGLQASGREKPAAPSARVRPLAWRTSSQWRTWCAHASLLPRRFHPDALRASRRRPRGDTRRRLMVSPSCPVRDRRDVRVAADVRSSAWAIGCNPDVERGDRAWDGTHAECFRTKSVEPGLPRCAARRPRRERPTDPGDQLEVWSDLRPSPGHRRSRDEGRFIAPRSKNGVRIDRGLEIAQERCVGR